MIRSRILLETGDNLLTEASGFIDKEGQYDDKNKGGSGRPLIDL